MSERNTVVRSLHDIGLGAWLDRWRARSVSTAPLPTSRSRRNGCRWRTRAGTAGRRNLGAIAAHLVGGAGLLYANKGRVASQKGVGTSTVAKLVLTGAALGASAWSRALGAKLDQYDGVPVQGGTDPRTETPAAVATAQRQLKVLQRVIPALTGGIVVLNALHGEQQRPNQQLPGILQGAAQLTRRATDVGREPGTSSPTPTPGARPERHTPLTWLVHELVTIGTWPAPPAPPATVNDDAAPRALIQFRLLGQVEAWRDGERVELGGRKQRAVLASLLVRAGRVVSLDQLVDDLWPEHPPARAAATVQVFVSNLRRALEPDRPAGRRERCWSRRRAATSWRSSPAAVDAQEFVRLAEQGRAALDGDDPEQAAAVLRRALELLAGPGAGRRAGRAVRPGRGRPAGRNCGSAPSRTASTPNSRWAGTARWWPSWSSRCGGTRCGSGCGPS